jgi:hypothetical protein
VAVVSHAAIMHLLMVPEHPLHATGAQVGNWRPVAVARLLVEPSSPRAPPLF